MAIELAVGRGVSRTGGVVDKGDILPVGDMMFAALARRVGVGPEPTPVDERSEFMDALRSNVGVAERESRPLEGLRDGTRGEWEPMRLVVRNGVVGSERRDELAARPGEVASESCFRERVKSSSRMLFVDDCRRRGNGWRDGDAMRGRVES